MPLKPAIKKDVTARLEKYEGHVNHLYLDTKGRVTVGVGHLIASRHVMHTVPLWVPKNNLPFRIATLAEKNAEYDSMVSQEDGLPAGSYAYELIMAEVDIVSRRDGQISEFYGYLTRIYRKHNGYPANFDDFDENVQRALFDMIFNLGPNKIVHTFKTFDAALKASNWTQASEESFRPDVPDDRNAYVCDLLLAAAARVKAKPTQAKP
jgi:GH24 family phage-related lysozyme (muramidase)